MIIDKVKRQGSNFLVNDSVFVPNDADNTDYINIQKFLQDGGTLSTDTIEEIKTNKLNELNAFYSSDDNWIFTIRSTEYDAEVTNTANWFARHLPAIDGDFYLFSNTGSRVDANITTTKARKINNEINIVRGFMIKEKQLQIKQSVNSATTIAQLNNINPKNELLSINRIVILEEI